MRLKFLFVLLLLLLGISSCNQEEENPDPFADCTEVVVSLPAIYLNLLDENGSNVIANGSFTPADIRLVYPQFIETNALGAAGTSLENFIRVELNGLGTQTVILVLSETVSETFSFRAIDTASGEPPSLNEFGCPTSTITIAIQDALYNSIVQEVEELDNELGDFVITVVR